MIRRLWLRVKHSDPIVWVAGVAAVCVTAVFALDFRVQLDYELAANISLLFLAAFVTGFTVLYVSRSVWWRNEIGKIYLAKCVVLSLVLDQIAVVVWVEADYPFRQQIRFALYTTGAVVYLPMLFSLWTQQTADRRKAQTDVDRRTP